MLTKPRCLMVHGNLYDKGGAELFAVRALASLQRSGFHVDVLHSGGNINWSELEEWSGFKIPDINSVSTLAPKGLSGIILGIVKNNSLLSYAYSVYCASRVKERYDFIFSSYGELPIRHARVLQFFHVPLFFYDYESRKYIGGVGGGILKNLIRIFYIFLCRFVAGWDREVVEGNMALANSLWTRGQAIRHYPRLKVVHTYIGAKTNAIFDEPIGDWWRSREDTIVILGRVVPSKNITMAVQFIDRLRCDGYNINLCIIGNSDPKYSVMLGEMIKGKEYISWMTGLSRDELEERVSRCKWGLHCAPYEHYGIAAIELQRLGCLTLVPGSCGQSELVHDDRFKFHNEDDLFRKFSSIYKSDVLRCQLDEARRKVIKNHDMAAHDKFMVDTFDGIKACISR